MAGEESRGQVRVIKFPPHDRSRGVNSFIPIRGGETPTTLISHEAGCAPMPIAASSKPLRPLALNAQADGFQEPRRSFLLPLDVMPNILLRLPAQSIIRFKSVCKLFYTLTNEPSFTHSYAIRAAPAQIIRTVHRLPGEGDRHSDLHLVKSSDDGLEIEVVRETRIIHGRKKGLSLSLEASCDGMLCFFVRRERRCYICNPLIGDWIPLPDSAYRLCRYGRMVAFYYYSPAGEYRLLWRVRATANDRYEVLSLGSSEWRRIRNSSLDACLIVNEYIPMHERLYWATAEAICWKVSVPLIIVFDMEAEEFSKMSIPSSGRIRTSNGESDPQSHHLLRLGEGQLCWCQVTKLMEIHIYLLKDYTREVWVEQYTISLQGVALPCNPPHCRTNRHRNDQPSGFNSNGVPYIRPMMTTVRDDDDQEIVFGWYDGFSPSVLGVLSYNTKLNKARSMRVKGSFPSEHLDHQFNGQYVETPVSCHYIDKRRRCVHCGN